MKNYIIVFALVVLQLLATVSVIAGIMAIQSGFGVAVLLVCIGVGSIFEYLVFFLKRKYPSAGNAWHGLYKLPPGYGWLGLAVIAAGLMKFRKRICVPIS